MFIGSLLYCKFKSLGVFTVPRDMLCNLSARCILGYLCHATQFAAIYWLPYTMATVLVFSAPVSVVIVTALFGNERLTRVGYLAVVMAMAGVILMTSPETMLFWL